ncbi:MAG: carbon monoxide dehydrogenase subunit G [Crocinitomicaceae bacterium]|jgi:carbon monoxide dehydrogenase subunit G
MKKTIIDRKITINAPKHEVWDALADFGNVMNMSPNIAKSYLISDKKSGIGAQRHCDFTVMGAQVDEKITQWDEGNSMTIELYNLKRMPMMKEVQARFEVSEKEGKAVLNARFEYLISNPIGRFMNLVKMRKMNIKSWEAFMAGIQYHVETGENIDNTTRLDLSKVTS